MKKQQGTGNSNWSKIVVVGMERVNGYKKHLRG